MKKLSIFKHDGSYRIRWCVHETQNEISFYYQKKSVYIILITGDIKFNLFSGLVTVKQSIKYVNKPEREIESSMLEETMQVFIEEVLRYTFL